MNRTLRLIAAALGILAGLLQIYNAIAHRQAGAPFPTGDVAMGVFWLAFGLWIGGDHARHNPH